MSTLLIDLDKELNFIMRKVRCKTTYAHPLRFICLFTIDFYPCKRKVYQAQTRSLLVSVWHILCTLCALLLLLCDCPLYFVVSKAHIASHLIIFFTCLPVTETARLTSPGILHSTHAAVNPTQASPPWTPQRAHSSAERVI